MSPSNSNALLKENLTSLNGNNETKRSFSETTTENDTVDNNTNHKRKKMMMNSQDGTNKAVITACNGYMTRSKSNGKSHGSQKINITYNTSKKNPEKVQLRTKPSTAKKNRNFKSDIKGKRLKMFDYDFSYDISSLCQNQLTTKPEKNTSLLFDSDSETETYYQTKIKMKNNEGKEKISNVSTSQYTSLKFTKSEVKTYYNKKQQNKSNISLIRHISNKTVCSLNMSPNSGKNINDTFKADSFTNETLPSLLSKESLLENSTNSSLNDLCESSPTVVPNHNITSRPRNKKINAEKVLSTYGKNINLIESSNVLNLVEKNNYTNGCENVFQNGKNKKLLDYSAPRSNSNYLDENINDNDSIVVTDEFIKQLEEELKMEIKGSKNESNNPEKLHYIEKCDDNIYIMVQAKESNESKKSPLNSSINQNDMCNIDSDVIKGDKDFNLTSNISLLKQEKDTNQFMNSTPLPTKNIDNIENNFSSIFDISENNMFAKNYISEEQKNNDENLIFHPNIEKTSNILEKTYNFLQSKVFENCNSEKSVENCEEKRLKNENDSLILEKKINYSLEKNTNQNLHSNIDYEKESKIKKKFSEVQYTYRNVDTFYANDHLDLKTNNSPKKNIELNPKCFCKSIYSLNNDANKILTPKNKHFAFDKTEEVRQKSLHQKNLEANILKKLISQNHKYVVHLEKLIPNFESILMQNENDKKKKSSIKLNENDHIEPRILNMLKDVYVDVEYLSESCDYIKDDKLPKLPKSCDKNIQTSNKNSIKNYFFTKKVNTSNIGGKSDEDSFIFEENTFDKSYFNIQTQESENSLQSVDIKANIKDSSNSIKIKLYHSINEKDPSVMKNSSQKLIKSIQNKIHFDNNSEHLEKDKQIKNFSKIFENEPKKSRQLKICFNDNSKCFIEDQELKNFSKVIENVTKKSPEHPQQDIIFEKNVQCSDEDQNIKNSSTFFKKESKKLPDQLHHEIFAVDSSRCSIEYQNLKNFSKVTENVTNKSPEHPQQDIVFEKNIQCSDKDQNIKNSSTFLKKEIKNSRCLVENQNLKKSIDFKINQEKLNHNIKSPVTHIQQSYPEKELMKEANNLINDEEIQLNSISQQIIELSHENLFELPNYNIEDSLSNNNSDNRNLLQNDFTSFHLPELSTKNKFESSFNDIENSLNNNYSDDDDKLQIDDDFDYDENSTFLHSSDDNSKNSKTTNTVLDDNMQNNKISIQLSKNELINPENNENSMNNSESHINIDLKPLLLQDESHNVFDKYNNELLTEKKENSLEILMNTTSEMCNDYYNKRSLSLNNITSHKDVHFPKNIKNIFTEMYVDEIYVSICQHMSEFNNYEIDLENKNIYNNIDHKNISVKFDTEMVSNINTKNEKKVIIPELKQLIPMNTEVISSIEFNKTNDEHNSLKKKFVKIKESNSPQPSNIKSNPKIRQYFREFINSKKSLDEILETKEFRSLRFFKEEEIALSICVFIFEKVIDKPTINGLSVYRMNYDELNVDERNTILRSTVLSIHFPTIMKLTSITLALVKMLRSSTLVDLILNFIRKNILNKKMNTDHTLDPHLITQTTYFVDICVRLRKLKTLQTLMFDAMVLLPNKYCCVIFISLLLWNNCLPKCLSNKEDPVIIMIMSCLIAKKKSYSKQTVGCDIFQRELINLLSCHFNYSFSTDLPTNFIEHLHKPDFFISVVMFLKCCNSKDMTEFVVNCLCPIIENYLNTQQNEMYALKIMESLNMAIKPFQISCNTIVVTYLNKCKGLVNNSKKDEKDHIYNVMYHSYKTLLNIFIEYLKNDRPRSQLFEETLATIIMVLGSVDYITSSVALMKWKPIYELSAISTKKFNAYKSIVGLDFWNKVSAVDDENSMKCLLNSCLIKKDIFDTLKQLNAIH